jgi:hypothetical protein
VLKKERSDERKEGEREREETRKIVKEDEHVQKK